ncbi:MAG: sulfatase-like hydrolase/transferase [Phycisphaeraceae bacterium JB051]
MSKHPNILFLMSDEHRPDVLGFTGNDVVRTPVLDDLAKDAVVFNNAYTPSPICIPSRQCIAAGQLPRTCKAEKYGDDLPPFSMTFAKRLSQFGYAAVCAGKLHHDGPDQMQGWTTRIGFDMNVEPKYIPGRDDESFKAFRHPSSYRSRDEAGEVVRSGVGHGRYTHDRDAHALAGVKPFIEHHYNDIYADKPCANQPLLLKVSFNRPHLPYLTTEDKINYYLNRVPIYVEDNDFEHTALNRGSAVVGKDGITERDVRKATAAYYGMVEEVDEDYGKVIADLKHVGQNMDDWWIIFTADHGSMLGQHGTWSKSKFYEHSARVPLMIRPPKAVREQWGMQPGKTRFVDQNVNTCDLFTTICQMANVPLPKQEDTVFGRGLDSRSLYPLMQSDEPVANWDDESISQFRGGELMIKQGSLKYQHYQNMPSNEMTEVLFDLAVDPDERVNLINEPEYTEALKALRRRCAALGFGPDAVAQYENAGYPWQV